MTDLRASALDRPVAARAVARRRLAPPPAARVLGVTLVLVILLQRLALPVGDDGVSLVMALVMLVVLGLLATGGLTPDLPRVQLFLIATAACAFVAWLQTLQGGAISTNSLFLLLLVYVPWLFRVPGPARQAGFDHVGQLYVITMLVAAIIAIGQMVLQLLSVWTYVDLVAEVVPPRWLLAAYNTNNPLEYASPVIKSQAFVFLEPSFLSQFLALALIIAILRRAPLWQLIVLGVAIFCTYSGTGMILLAIGLLVIAVRAPRTIRPSMVVLGVAAVTALLLSPYAEPLLNRTGETTDSSSSLSLRFIVPYQQVAEGLEEEPLRYLIGAGPGAAERVLESSKEGGGLAVVYTIIPKLIFEYGFIAGSLFLTFLAVTLFRRAPGPVLPVSLLVLLALLSGSLLQPHTLLVAWLLSAAWSRE